MLSAPKIVVLLTHLIFICASKLPTHQTCVINEYRNGTCRDVKDCSLDVFLKGGICPKYCTTSRSQISEVCCPIGTLSDFPEFAAITSVSKIVEIEPVTSECGIKGTVIQENRRGPYASINEWPWMALLIRLQKTDKDDTGVSCNGVLISDQYVLTTAQCIFQGPFFVRLGEHNFDYTSDGAKPIDVPVVNTLFHPKFQSHLGYHKLALVKLAYKILDQPAISPVCLPLGTLSPSDNINRPVTLTGWAATHLNRKFLPTLQEREKIMFSSAECEEIYSTTDVFNNDFPHGLTVDNTVCAGDRDIGKYFCQRARGSPLIYQNVETGKWILEGIHTASGCGSKEKPGIYTSVRNSEHLRWIMDVIYPTEKKHFG